MTPRQMKARLVELETQRIALVKQIERGIDYEDDDLIQTLHTIDDTIDWLYMQMADVMREEMAV